MKLWRHDLALAGCVLALYHEVFTGSGVVIGRDVLHWLAPVGAAVGAGLTSDASLLWATGTNQGLPLLAGWAPAVFYPAQWLHAVFSPLAAISIGVVLHVFLAAAATLRLALRYTPSPHAAWVAAAGFAFGGYVICVTTSGGYLFGAALLPVSLLALHRLAEAPSLLRAGQLAAVIALQLFCADPQTLFYEGLFLAPLILLPGRDGRARRLALAALGAALGLAIATCQWWPAVELAGLSVRAGGATANPGAWAFHPLRLVQLLVPHGFGTVTPENTFWARALVNSELSIPWAPLVSVGLLPIAGLSAVAWNERRLQVLAAVTGFFLLLAFGPWLGVWDAVTAILPGAKLFRYPEKFLLFVSLGLAILGAAGLGRLLEPDRAPRIRVAGVLGAVAIAALGTWAIVDRERFGALFAWARAANVDADTAFAVSAGALLHTAAIAGLLAAVIALAPRLRPAIVIGGIAVLVAADVLPPARALRYVASSSTFAAAPAACAALAPSENGRAPTIWRAPLVYLEHGPQPEGARFERQRRWEWDTLKPNVGAAFCARFADGYEAARLSTWQALWVGLRADPERQLRLFGVQHVLARPGVLGARFPERSVAPSLGLGVYDVPAPLAFAVATGRAEAIATSDAAVARLRDPAFDFAHTVLLERAEPAVDHGDAARTATLVRHRSGAFTVAVDFAAPGYLMLLESMYPGWRVDSDLGALPLARTNGHFLGLELPAGKRTLTFVFDPPLQRKANAISLVALVAFAALLGWGFVRGSRRK